MREASIYVDVTTFSEVLKEYFDASEETLHTIALELKIRSRIKQRRLVTITKEQKKKAEKLLLADSSEAELFNATLVHERLNKHHKGVLSITKEHFEYPTLMQVTALAVQFCNDFNYSYKEGFTVFIIKGLEFMGNKYGLNRFKTYFNKIVGVAQDTVEWNSDDSEDKTNEFIDIWEKCMHKVGARNYVNIPVEKKVCLLRGRREAEGVGAKYLTWILAQFAGLEFTGNVPDFSQYYGEAALGRYYQYINAGKNNSTQANQPKYTGASDVERAYFASLNK